MPSNNIPPPQAHYTPVVGSGAPSTSYATTALSGMLSWGLNQFSSSVGAQTGLPQHEGSSSSSAAAPTANNSKAFEGSTRLAQPISASPSQRGSIDISSDQKGGISFTTEKSAPAASSEGKKAPPHLTQDREFYFGPSHFKASDDDDAELYEAYREISEL